MGEVEVMIELGSKYLKDGSSRDWKEGLKKNRRTRRLELSSIFKNIRTKSGIPIERLPLFSLEYWELL